MPSTAECVLALPFASIPRWAIWDFHDTLGKPPLRPDGKRASFDKPNDMSKADSAIEAARACGYVTYRNGWEVPQVCFAVGAEDSYVLFDLDDCRSLVTKRPNEVAAEIVLDLDSYTETSPSGEGVRVVVRVDNKSEILDKYGGYRKANLGGTDIEVMVANHWCSITGLPWITMPRFVGNRTAQVNALLEKLFGEPKVVQQAERQVLPQGAGGTMTDVQILAMLRKAKNGRKFAALFDRGDLTDFHGDHSRADLGLCAMIAFYTKKPVQMDRLFRRSKLFRDKWDRRLRKKDPVTYGQATVARAISSSKCQYHGSAALSDRMTSLVKRRKKVSIREFIQFCHAGKDEVTLELNALVSNEVLGYETVKGRNGKVVTYYSEFVF